MSGGWAAKELTEKGLKTLVLDRGRMVKHGEYPTATTDPWDLPYGNRITQENPPPQAGADAHQLSHPRQPALVRRRPRKPLHRDQPLRLDPRLSRWRRSLMWARQSYRFSPMDFEANAKEGIGVPWPVNYDEIAPWYDYVETFAGISGSLEGHALAAGWKIPAADGAELRRGRFPEAHRRQARPQAHHRPRRQSHRAAHPPAEPAAWHLPVPQPVHSRLPVRRVLQQRFRDAAFRGTHRQHDLAG